MFTTSEAVNHAQGPDAWLSLVNDYGTASNNGNVMSQVIGRYGQSKRQTFTFDGMNPQTALTESGTTFNYYYDGEGRRVKKVVNGLRTVFVYDAGGELAAEYSEAANAESGTQFLTEDHLGSTRLVTDAAAGIVHETNYYPFGEEINGGDWFNPKFTAKLRDYESGLNLDYFGARYYAGAMGRFTSADPIILMDQKLVDPQQWNMYSYVRNNPLRLIDPTGMYVCNGTQSECKAFEKQRQNVLKSKNTDVSSGAAAYGDAGKDNGVTVGFVDPKGKPDWKNKAGNATASLEVDPNDPTKFRANVDVQIKKGQSGVALRDTIAHEGIHTRDAQAFAATATMGGQYDLSKNLTVWQTEMNAYSVSAAVWSEAGKTSQFGTCGGSPCAFGPGMSAASVRATSILFLATPRMVITGSLTSVVSL